MIRLKLLSPLSTATIGLVAMIAQASTPVAGSVAAHSPENASPVLVSPGDQTVHVGTTLFLQIQANDPDGDPLTMSATGANAVMPETYAPYIGINLCPINDGDPMKIFADAIKSSRGFSAVDSHSVFAATDAQGWPVGDAGIVVWNMIGNTHGIYRLSFTTQNPAIDARTVTVSLQWDQGTAALHNQSYDASSNTIYYDLAVTEANERLRLIFTDTQGGVRDVKLMRPILPGCAESYDPSVVFTTAIKQVLKKFSVLRFMQVVFTMQGNEVAEWADRTQTDYCCQQTRYFGVQPSEPGHHPYAGVAWEYLIQLCNEVNVDLWVNIPFLATDDYIEQLAKLIKETLNPSLNIYTEYSNELWYFTFPYDGRRNYEAAKAEVAQGNSPLNYDGEENTYYHGWRRTAKRNMEISNIFRSVFGDDAMMTRVRPLLMNQLNNGQNTLGQGLKLMQDYYNNPDHVSNPRPPNYYFYGAGGAPYYKPEGEYDIDSIWSSGSMDVSVFAQTQLLGDAALCATFGLKHIAYEGGPELNQSEVDRAAWNDPRMTQSIINHHHTWSQHGGDLFVYFTLNNWGQSDVKWSFIQLIDEADTAKMQAIDILNQTPKRAINWGNSIPGSVDGARADESTASQFMRAHCNWLWRSYVFRVEQAGSYGITVDVSNVQDDGAFEVMVSGTTVGSHKPPMGSGGRSPEFTVDLEPGLHGVMVRITQGAFQLDQLNMYPTPH